MLLDKLVASFAGMAATLYLLSGCMAWYRLMRPRRKSLPNVRSVILDRAIAWSSLAVLFAMIVSIKLGYFEGSDDRLDVFRIVCLAAIYVCGLISIRSITIRQFGHSAVSWFAGLSAAVGLLILFF